MKSNPFLFGAATSSHQIEGGNKLNDWWAWEQAGRVKESSGAACNHFHSYEHDFDLIHSLGHTAYRFSIEWSRLEPKEDEWDEAAFQHYQNQLIALKRRGIEPVVTLHHFTLPLWFSQKGGFEHPDSASYFRRYTEKAVERFAPFVRYWITINEPLIYLYFGYLEGSWPPGVISLQRSAVVLRALLHSHIESYDAIHSYFQKLGLPVWVSIAKHVSCFTPARTGNVLDLYAVKVRNWFFNEMFLNALTQGFLFFPGVFCEFLPRAQTLDFLGLNYYTRDFIRFKNFSLHGSMGDAYPQARPSDAELNFMGWEVYPDGLYQVLKKLKRYQLPIMITENGICTHQDDQRIKFIQTHLASVERARQEGVQVTGFFYWSLLDNFEWAHGFGPRFGLIEVDYATQKRIVRNSAQTFTELCRTLFQE